MKRITDSKLYNKWKANAFKKFHNRCAICRGKSRLEVHHIRNWSQYPTMRYNDRNAILLCNKHHKKMWKKEEDFAAFCFMLLAEIERMENDIYNS